ncbi:hypothetical protein LY78DRAFT_256860 [Colletotrichum sublineola]|nr:hypothetical protein LY78DRAFT_256860 [Colletotrichum sublineola]
MMHKIDKDIELLVRNPDGPSSVRRGTDQCDMVALCSGRRLRVCFGLALALALWLSRGVCANQVPARGQLFLPLLYR